MHAARSEKPATTRVTVVVALVALAFVLRAGVVWWLSDTVPYTDFALYHVAGAEIARDPGFLFDPDVGRQLPQVNWWPPGYPVFLATVYSVFGSDHRTAVWIQVLLGTLVCVLVYRIAANWADERVARVAAVLVVFNPTFVFLTNQLASENLFVLWLALGMWRLSVAEFGASDTGARTGGRESHAAINALVVGVLFGLGAMTRAIGLIVPLVVIVWTWHRARAGAQKGRVRRGGVGRCVAWMIAGVVVVVAPWSVRNAVVVGRPALVSFAGGLNFYFGHNANRIGYQDLASTPLGSITDPVQLDETGYKLGLEFIAAHPVRDAVNGVRKFGALYAFPDYALHVNSGILVPDVGAHPELQDEANERLARQRARDRWLHGPLMAFARVYHVLLLAAALWGLMRWRRLAPGLELGAWLALAWTVAHVVYWAQPRFLAPAELPLVLLAASSLAWAAARLRSSSRTMH